MKSLATVKVLAVLGIAAVSPAVPFAFGFFFGAAVVARQWRAFSCGRVHA